MGLFMHPWMHCHLPSIFLAQDFIFTIFYLPNFSCLLKSVLSSSWFHVAHSLMSQWQIPELSPLVLGCSHKLCFGYSQFFMSCSISHPPFVILLSLLEYLFILDSHILHQASILKRFYPWKPSISYRWYSKVLLFLSPLKNWKESLSEIQYCHGATQLQQVWYLLMLF